MQILKNSEIPLKKWNELQTDNQFSSIFQTPEFYNFYNSVKNLSALAMAVEDNGRLDAILVVTLQKEKSIKGFFSKRAIIYGGPLVREGSRDALSFLFQNLENELHGKAIYIEIRNLFDYSKYTSLLDKEGWKYRKYLNFRVSCKDETTIWSNLNRLRKRQIKKAVANKVITCMVEDMDDVRALYEILDKTYRKNIKKPLFEWDFFKNLSESGFCKVFLVKAGTKIIGGHFCLFDKKVIYDWYGCGLDRTYKDFAPSTMVVYTALKFGAANNMEYFDFMGAGTPDQEYGVRDFKAQFGGELVEYGRFIKILDHFRYKIGETGMNILSGR